MNSYNTFYYNIGLDRAACAIVPWYILLSLSDNYTFPSFMNHQDVACVIKLLDFAFCKYAFNLYQSLLCAVWLILLYCLSNSIATITQ